METKKNELHLAEDTKKPTCVIGFARAIKARVDDFLLMRRVDRLLAEGHAKQGKRKLNP